MAKAENRPTRSQVRPGANVSIGGSVQGPVVVGDHNVTLTTQTAMVGALAQWAQSAQSTVGGLPAGATSLDADQLRQLEQVLDDLAAADPRINPVGRLAKLRDLAIILLTGAGSELLAEVAKKAPELWH